MQLSAGYVILIFLLSAIFLFYCFSFYYLSPPPFISASLVSHMTFHPVCTCILTVVFVLLSITDEGNCRLLKRLKNNFMWASVYEQPQLKEQCRAQYRQEGSAIHQTFQQLTAAFFS